LCPKPLILIILDGWGYRAETKANAIALARKPTYDRLLREYPNTLIHTSGPFVGLPEGQMGNSEVGHLNIGAGRIVHMDITRIDLMIQNGEFFSHPVLLAAMKHARVGERRLHLFGLVSDGGVHSQQAHLYALLKMAKEQGLGRVFVHAFMDGRDTLPTNGAGYLEQLQQKMREYNCGKIATVNGRYYAMDRDRRWERIEKAYDAIVRGGGLTAASATAAIQQSYASGVTDEFIVPTVVLRDGQPVGRLQDGDAVIFFNFRGDRGRELTKAILLPDFEGFERGAPDGSAMDSEGYLWNCRFFGGCIVRVASDVKFDRVVEMPLQKITTCTFGGPDLKTLYVTTARIESPAGDRLAGGLYAIPTKVAGQAENVFKISAARGAKF